MNGLWDILSVAIGISFIFMILSILNSWLQEYIATLFSLRAKNLADVLQNMFEPQAKKLNGINKAYTPFPDGSSKDGSGKLTPKSFFQAVFGGNPRESVGKVMDLAKNTVADITEAQQKDLEQSEGGGRGIAKKMRDNPVRYFYEHPIVYSLSKPNSLPGYIPNNDFTVALIDLLDKAGRDVKGGKKTASDKITMTNIKKGIASLKGPLGERLKALEHSAQINSKKTNADIEDFRDAVSTWFDDTMDRGKTWYKRKMQRIGIICGVILAIALNADTISISNALWHNAVLRDSLSQAAEASAQQGAAPDSEQAQQQLEDLMDLGLPLGWAAASVPTTAGGWVSKSIGLLLTGFAISQGSQLWFDLMNRLINLRSSGLKPEDEEHPAKAKSK